MGGDNILKLLATSRSRIGARVRDLRRARRWTQAELASRLRVSQPHLSQVERGAGSLTAERFLTVLRLFNVSASEFEPRQKVDREAALQNVLARLGGADLQERDDVLPAAQIEEVSDAVRETLVTGSPRLLTALAPVLVANADRVSLRRLDARLAELGLERRLGWLVENVVEAVKTELASTLSRSWARRYRRASVVFETHLEALTAHHARRPDPDAAAVDVLDPEIRSRRTRELVEASRSPISRRWGIITGLQPEDFVRALRSARVGT